MAVYAVEERYVPEDDRFWFLLVDITAKEANTEGNLQYRIISKHDSQREAEDAWRETFNE